MGRMVCEGSGQTPIPRHFDVFDVNESGVSCSKCDAWATPLKSGLMPKHTRYVSWKEQQAMLAAGIPFEKRDR